MSPQRSVDWLHSLPTYESAHTYASALEVQPNDVGLVHNGSHERDRYGMDVNVTMVVCIYCFRPT